MEPKKVAYIARAEVDTELIEQGLEGLDYELDVHMVNSEGEVIEAIKGADIILNGGIPMPKKVIDEIDTAQAIIVGSHGFNHIDHEAVCALEDTGQTCPRADRHAIVQYFFHQ